MPYGIWRSEQSGLTFARIQQRLSSSLQRGLAEDLDIEGCSSLLITSKSDIRVVKSQLSKLQSNRATLVSKDLFVGSLVNYESKSRAPS